MQALSTELSRVEQLDAAGGVSMVGGSRPVRCRRVRGDGGGALRRGMIPREAGGTAEGGRTLGGRV